MPITEKTFGVKFFSSTRKLSYILILPNLLTTKNRCSMIQLHILFNSLFLALFTNLTFKYNHRVTEEI